MNTTSTLTALTVMATLGAACVTLAQPAMAAVADAPSEEGRSHAKLLAIRQVPAKTSVTLAVSSPSFGNDADIPFENTAYRGNVFPGLTWSRGPAGTRSYAAVMQGALAGGDDMSRGSSIHFVVFNIPAGRTRLEPGITRAPVGAMHGNTVHDMKDFYAGPHTHNFDKHGYHFQVFALDTTLPASDDMTLGELEKRMQGHVLASGETVGFAAMDPESDEGKAFATKPR